MPFVSKAEFARNLRVSKARVSQYVSHGLPLRDDGKVDLDVGTRWVAHNFRPNERNEDKGASRASQNVKQNGRPNSKVNGATHPPLNPPPPADDLTLQDVLKPAIREAGKIAARMAVAAGAPMEVAFAIDDMVAIELSDAMMARFFSEADRTVIGHGDWPFDDRPDDAAEEAQWRALAIKAAEPFDPDAWSAFLDGLPWSQTRSP